MRIVVIGEEGDSVRQVSDCRDRLRSFVTDISVEVASLPRTRDVLVCGDICVDLVRQVASRQGVALNLDPIQLRFLACLMERKGEIVSREKILQDVWHWTTAPQTTILETTLSRLRAKIDSGRPGSLIETVKGKGYRIV